MFNEHQNTAAVRRHSIDTNDASSPVPIPPGHVGEFVIPGTGKRVWWTGRVAIGLRHQPQRCFEPVAQSSLWLQELMLGSSGRVGRNAA